MIIKKALHKSSLLYIILALATILVSWFSLELSQGFSSKSDIFRMNITYIVLNILTLGVVYAVWFIIFNRLWITNILHASLFCIISLINYYTVKLHGSPFTIHELSNIKTATNVLGMYQIDIDRYVLLIILLNISIIVLSIAFRKYESIWNNLSSILIRNILLLLLGFLVLYKGYWSKDSIKPHNTITWTWENSYHTYGYMACSIETIMQSFHIVTEPDGYSIEKVNDIDIDLTPINAQTPDIILILNESFYDLSLIMNIETDIPYLENINSLDNCIRGYAVVPIIGGGTNNSEYELLTANSSSLLANVTPFNVFSMKDENTIVSYLAELGYTTLGAHAAAATNYNRNRAYPNMGFNYIYFREDFEDVAYYEKRDIITDSSAYTNLIRWYENAPKNNPLFMYLLTIQNHGGWDTNSPNSAIVHSLNDYGSWTNDINEYLSCIHLSDIAFKELTDYFCNIDRPVIICMVGDHAPSFISEITGKQLSYEEQQLLFRSTPYCIWANFDLTTSLPQTMSMNYLMPSLFEAANIKRSAYMQYMINLREQLPILTSYGKYYDKNGMLFDYSEDNSYKQNLMNYYYLEYNNLSNHRIQPLFSPK